MKIQGPNPLINTYRNQQQKQAVNKNKHQQDELKISQEAKELQKNGTNSLERDKYVAEIKKMVQADEYEINHNKVAEKMIDFWTKRV